SLKDRAADLEKEHKTMVTDYTKAKEDYQKLLISAEDQAVSTEERDKRKKTASEKLKQLKESEDTILAYERQAKETLNGQNQRMRDNIITEIRAVLEAKAKTAGFSLVLDNSAESFNKTPIVFYTNNDNDLTESVLAQLNAGAPVETSKSDDLKDEKKPDAKKKDSKK